MDSTSASLLSRLRQPDAPAWRQFVALYAPLIYYWGRGQKLSETDSAELVQEVMLVLVDKLPGFQYDPQQRFRGWLRTIAVNKARDLWRRQAARPPRDTAKSVDEVADAAGARLFEEAEHRSFIARRALLLMQSEFQPTTWKACWKQVVEGARAADAACELGISPNAALVAKSRVLRRLREALAHLVD